MKLFWATYPWIYLACVSLWIFYHRRFLDWQEALEPLLLGAIPGLNVIYAGVLLMVNVLEEIEAYEKRKRDPPERPGSGS